MGGHAPDVPGSACHQYIRRRIGQHAPFLQNHQAVGNGLHIPDNMGTQKNDPTAGQAGEQRAKAYALGGIESSGRLIDNQEFGVVEQGLGDADALLHAAGIGNDKAFVL